MSAKPAAPFLFDSQNAYTDALKFLAAIGNISLAEAEKHRFCFQVFPNMKKTDFRDQKSLPEGVSHALPMHRTGSIHDSINWLRRSNEMTSGGLCGIYVVVNETDGRGRKATNVIGVRALFLELDHGGLQAAHLSEFATQFGASIVVESSPGKCHCYWLLSDFSAIPLDKFSTAQALLMQRFKALKAGIQSKDLSQVLRVPGFIHLKDLSSPFLVRLHYCNPSVRYDSVDAIFAKVGIDSDFISKHRILISSMSSNASRVVEITEGEHREYAGVSAGNRNESMYTYVLNVIRVKGLNYTEALGAAMAANLRNVPPLDRNELETCVGSAWKKFLASDQKSKFDQAQELFDEWVPESEEGDSADGVEDYESHNFKYNYNRPVFISPVSDAALTERIVQKFSDRLRVNPSTGTYFYEDNVWKHRGTYSGRAAFQPHYNETMSRIYFEPVLQNYFVTAKGALDVKAIKGFMKEVLSNGKFKSILDQSLPNRKEMLVEFTQFDSTIGIVPTLSGMLNVRTGELAPVTDRHFFTKQLPILFDASATCPAWQQFIYDIMSGDAEMIPYLQKICGLILAGDTSNQCVYLLYGTGGNGKSKFLKVLSRVLGDFAGEMSSDAIIKGYGPVSIPILSGLAQAYGKRLIAVGEVPEKAEWNESLIKALSGDDVIVAKYYNKDVFEYLPTYSMMIRANHKPTVVGSDAGIWDRFRIIPFLARFRDTEQDDKRIEDKLFPELSGILNWMVQGYQNFLAEGLSEPESAKLVKSAYRAQMNPWKDFIEEFTEPCEVASGMTVSEFLEVYNKWTVTSGADRLSHNNCGDKLDQMGIFSAKRRLEARTRVIRYAIKLTDQGVKILKGLKPDNVFQM